MKRILIVIFSILCGACSHQHDINFYKTHPQHLQDALTQCSNTSNLSSQRRNKCEQLRMIAIKMNTFIAQLSRDPQAFGQRILTLQTLDNQLHSQQRKVQQGVSEQSERADSTVVTSNVKNIEDELQMRLAIIKWLESPRK